MSDCKVKFEDFRTDKDEYEVKRHFPIQITISGKLETCRQRQPVNITVTTPKGKKPLKTNHDDKTGDFKILFQIMFDEDVDPSGPYQAIGVYLDQEGNPVYSPQINFKVNQIKDT